MEWVVKGREGRRGKGMEREGEGVRIDENGNEKERKG